MALFPSQVKTSSLIYHSKFTLASFSDIDASGQRETQSISEDYPAYLADFWRGGGMGGCGKAHVLRIFLRFY